MCIRDSIIAYIFKMNTILWIVSKLASALITAIVVIFQPELRKVVEQLGQKKIMASIFPFDSGKEVKERFTDKTVNELIKACFAMGEVKTGALIVIEQEIRLDEYVRTGINVDALLTSQLLINIFEHNTPLHDGAAVSYTHLRFCRYGKNVEIFYRQGDGAAGVPQTTDQRVCAEWYHGDRT